MPGNHTGLAEKVSSLETAEARVTEQVADLPQRVNNLEEITVHMYNVMEGLRRNAIDGHTWLIVLSVVQTVMFVLYLFEFGRR